MSALKLLVVDDDKHILNGIRRRLQRLQAHWKVRFAESGEEALILADGFIPDAIISDLRMPGMDGAELLGRVKEAFPLCFRVALSGHAETSLILRAMEHAHRIQSKPCTVEMLACLVDEGVRLLKNIEGNGLDAWIGGIERLPAPPQGLQRLISELQQTGTHLSKVETLLQGDMALSAHLLHVANSAFFGGGMVESILQAIQRLGLDVVQGIVTSYLVEQNLFLPPACIPVMEVIRRDCQAVIPYALKRNQKSFQKGFKVDVLTTAVLLQDIGKLILLTYQPEVYRRIHAETAEVEADLVALERAAFGYSHTQVGAWLLQLWGLPESIVTAVALHHEACNAPCVHSLACLLFMAGQDMLAERAPNNSFFMPRLSPEALSAYTAKLNP